MGHRSCRILLARRCVVTPMRVTALTMKAAPVLSLALTDTPTLDKDR